MKVISIINSGSGCDYHRIKLPIAYMHKAGLISGVQADTLEDSIKAADIVFYNRIPYGIPLERVQELQKQHGFKIVMDLDDYWNLYPGHYLESIWKRHGYDRQIIQNIQAADAVTCTSDRLADKIRAYHDNVFVVPNGLPFGDLQFTEERMPSDHLRFIYAGGGSHYWDIRLLSNTMRKLSREPFTSEVILAGVARGVDIYERMIDVMSNRGKLKRFRSLTYQPLDSYMNLYNEGDVALAPLVANTFNSHKSNLKVIEAGSKSMPIIVSNTGPYYDDECPHLMRVDSPGDWLRWIRYCEQNPAFVQDNGAALQEYVRRNYDIRLMNYLRMEAFESVMKNVKYEQRADHQPVGAGPGVQENLSDGNP